MIGDPLPSDLARPRRGALVWAGLIGGTLALAGALATLIYALTALR